ncbi:MAG: hypothetical protein IPO83_18055 [Chitinophagaceae bacterium]|nr:hypothetical protein [Chitinophagaceae bacterium]
MFQSAASSARGQARSAASNEMTRVSKNKFFKYLLVAFVLGAVTSMVGFLPMINPQWVHLMLMAILILLGILHLSEMSRRFGWSANNDLQAEFLFTLSVMLVGCIGFAIAFYAAGRYIPAPSFMNNGYTGLMSAAFIIFPLPWLLEKSFNMAISIPPERYKEWLFPTRTIVPDESIDRSRYAAVTIVLPKKYGDSMNSNLQGKAFYEIKLGDMFYFYIQEWNYKYPNDKIQYLDDENKSFGWYFYIKDKWWQSKRYLDPDLTIYQNGIRINQIIKGERVKLQ